MERHDECPSAIVREWEKEAFLQRHNIDGWQDPNYAANHEKGLHLAQIIAAVPLMPAPFRLGSPNDARGGRQRVEARQNEGSDERARTRAVRAAFRAFSEFTPKPGDYAFVADITEKRDAALASVIARAGGVGAVINTALNEHDDIEVRWDRSARMKHAPRVVASVDGRYIVSGAQGTHVLVCDSHTGFVVAPVDHSNRQVRTIAAMESLMSEPDSVTVAMLSRNNADPGQSDLVTFDPADQASLVDWLGALAIATEERFKRYSESKQPDGTPGAHMAAALDRNATIGAHCARCTGGICCGKLTDTLAQQHSHMQPMVPQLEAARPAIKKLTKDASNADSTNLQMNALTLATTLDTAKTVSDTLTLADAVWREGSELTRQIAAKKIATPGFGLKDGARLLKQRDEKQMPADIWDALSSLLPGLTLRDFVAKTCDVDPKAVESLLADKHNLDPKEVYEKLLAPLGTQNPFELRPNKPSVVRTAPKGIVIDEPLPLPERSAGKGTAPAR